MSVGCRDGAGALALGFPWLLFGCNGSTHWTPGSSREGLPVLQDARQSFSLV